MVVIASVLLVTSMLGSLVGSLSGDQEHLLLRSVWVTGDDAGTRFVKEELVTFGFAGVAPTPGATRSTADLNAAANQARDQKRGLRAHCRGPNQPLPTPPRLRAGSNVRSDRWEVTDLGVQRRRGPLVWTSVGNVVAASGQWSTMRIALTNISRGPLSPDASDDQLRTVDDVHFANFSEDIAVAQWTLRTTMSTVSGALAAGISTPTMLACDINPTVPDLRLPFRPVASRPFHLR